MTDSIDNRRILNPDAPREIAQIFLQETFWHEGIRSLQCVPSTEDFYVWENKVYRKLCMRELQSKLATFLLASWRRQKGGSDESLIPFNPKASREKEIIDALKNICCWGIKKDPEAGPSWIFSLEETLDPYAMIPFKNRMISIEKFLKDGDPFNCLEPITPKFFNCTQIPFDVDPYDCKGKEPVKFLKFLREVFQKDESSIQMLRQWMGYCLTNMTWAQKILLMVGPKRSGKGTIARVIQTMLGEANFTNPTSSSLIERFPLEGWINKRLAILGDARFGEKKDTVKEILLQVSGEDRINIDRKYCPILCGVKLPTKIMILSNEVPTIRDSGAALASRFLVLKMEKSFFGKEDPELFDRDLKPEIPLIVWWTLDGLRDLMAQKYFEQPESGKEVAEEMELYQSPVKAFVDDFCEVRMGLLIAKQTLYNSYESWCKSEGIETLTIEVFSRQLYSCCHSLKKKRSGKDGLRIQSFEGINLKDRV